MKANRFMSYRIESFRSYPRGWIAVAFVGPNRNSVVYVTRSYWTRKAAEQACIIGMRSRRRDGDYRMKGK